MKNATIISRLEDLFNFMDPRASVTIFKDIETGNELLRSNKLYTLISDNEFIGKYGKYCVIGLSVCLNDISILIKEKEEA